jgi:hypothetical protein
MDCNHQLLVNRFEEKGSYVDRKCGVDAAA